MGYPYGSDCQSFRVQADSWVKPNILLDIEYTLLKKGANLLSTINANENTLNDPFPLKPVNTYNLAKISISYLMNHSIIEVGWSIIPFANRIAFDGDVNSVKIFYLKLQSDISFPKAG